MKDDGNSYIGDKLLDLRPDGTMYIDGKAIVIDGRPIDLTKDGVYGYLYYLEDNGYLGHRVDEDLTDYNKVVPLVDFEVSLPPVFRLKYYNGIGYKYIDYTPMLYLDLLNDLGNGPRITAKTVLNIIYNLYKQTTYTAKEKRRLLANGAIEDARGIISLMDVLGDEENFDGLRYLGDSLDGNIPIYEVELGH